MTLFRIIYVFIYGYYLYLQRTIIINRLSIRCLLFCSKEKILEYVAHTDYVAHWPPERVGAIHLVRTLEGEGIEQKHTPCVQGVGG